MAPTQAQIDSFTASAAEAANTIRETTEEDGFIQIYSHLDADGIAAAGVMAKALWRLDTRFRTRVTQWVDEKIVLELTNTHPQLVVLTDFGSGYIDLLNEKAHDQKFVIL